MDMTLITTCPNETREILKEELTSLGVSNIVLGYRCLHFKTDLETYYALHLKLRTASSILRVIRVIRSSDEEAIFRQCLRIDWPAIFRGSFKVEGINADRSGQGLHPDIISKKVRLAVQQHFQKQNLPVPRVDLHHPDTTIVAYQEQYKCTISVNTSGFSLHKRGYRTGTATHPSPLKETLAASILMQVGYHGQKPLIDMMCGSGTIAVEAASIALNKSPLIHRKKGDFAFEKLQDFDNSLWRKVQDEARANKQEALAQPIFASDIEDKYVQMARENAKRARVEKHIRFSTCCFTEIKEKLEEEWMQDVYTEHQALHSGGIVIANLPYGDRMSLPDLKDFYRKVGDCLKQQFSGWKAVLIAAKHSPHKNIGLRPHKRYHFYNGNIEILALVYELYAGTRKLVKQTYDASSHTSEH